MRLIRIFLLISFICMGSVFAHAADVPDIEAALMDKNYEQVRDLSQSILKSSSVIKNRMMAQYYLGLAQLRLKQYAKAREAFQIVMQAAPNMELYDKACLGLIEGLQLAGFYKDALKQAQHMLRKRPDSPSKSLIYLRIARSQLKLTRWQEAKEYLQKILNEFPQSFEAPAARNLLEEKEYFAVQVGSFLEQEKAVKLSEDLKTKGQYAYVVQTTNNDGKMFYRVRVGQMTSLGQANSLQNQLSSQGYPTLIYP